MTLGRDSTCFGLVVKSGQEFLAQLGCYSRQGLSVWLAYLTGILVGPSWNFQCGSPQRQRSEEERPTKKFQSAPTENSSAGAEWGESLCEGIRLAPLLSSSFYSHSPLLHLMG